MPKIKVLPAWAVLVIAAGVVVLTAGAIVAILLWLNLDGLTTKDRATAQLDALRIGLSVGVGSGGVFALYIAARRQRSTELDLTQKVDAQESSDADAAERRTTELYTKAAEQLGSEKAVVRLAGLYALERLAQGTPEHRQTITDVLCGYLRMSFDFGVEGAENIQETQVRLTAQRILHRHLRPEQGGLPNPGYWGELDIDLSGATLVRFTLNNASVRFADFRGARFMGTAQFPGARFSSAIVMHCEFGGVAWFSWTALGEAGVFEHCRFGAGADFEGASFGNALFREAHFAEKADFSRASFAHDVDFEGAVFQQTPVFDGTRIRIDERRARVLPPHTSVRLVAGDESDRLDTVVPQRWSPAAAVTEHEREMPVEDQRWGFLEHRPPSRTRRRRSP